MAAAKKSAGVTRRTTGKKRGEGTKSAGTKTGRGQAPAQSAEAMAREEQKEQLEPVTLISGRGGFQLRCGGPRPDGTFEPEWHLQFGKKGFIVADDETLAAVEKVLAGEWSDGQVHGEVFRRNAKTARLQIIRHGMETPPIPAWEGLSSDSRVDVALQAGMLRTADAIKRAIRYENQSTERTAQLPAKDRRDADPVTVAKLEALLMAQSAGVKVQGVDAGGAASAGASPLLAGPVEL